MMTRPRSVANVAPALLAACLATPAALAQSSLEVAPPTPLPAVESAGPPPPLTADGVDPLLLDATSPTTPLAPPTDTDLSGQFSAAGAAAATAARLSAAQSRLAQAPEMFGDSIAVGGITVVTDTENDNNELGTTTSRLQFPIGGFGLKVSDNNSPLPRDRVYYRFSNYDALIKTAPRVDYPSTVQQFRSEQSLPVHTIGLEKTFCDGRASVEVRAPFSRRIDFDNTFISDDGSSAASTSYATAGEGNMSVITKAIIGADDDFIWGGGVAVEAPTGRDTQFDLFFTRGEYQNKAAYLYPYLAALWTPQSRVFHQALVGVNVPLGDDELVILDPTILPPTELSRVDIEPATTISIDWSTGYWLRQNASDRYITGIALIGEMHYTGSFGAPTQTQPDSGLFFSDIAAGASSVDYLNLTSGLHLQIGPRMSLRVSGVLPVADRPFDDEVTAQWTYWY